MKQVWIIAQRELKSFFDSLIAYILLVLFLGMSGFFTWLWGNGDVFFIGQASLQSFFGIAKWTLFFFIPALTMKMIAEEKRSGTIELLLTKAVSDWQFVFGKFLASVLLIVIALAFTLPYYISVSYLGPVDHGAVITGYMGLVLLSMAFVGIGLFASSITTNQIVAMLLSLFVSFLFFFLFDGIAMGFSGFWAQLFDFLSFQAHYESISRGVIDSKDIIYFLSVTGFCLLLTESVLSKRNIVE